eukprot:gnl/MRDRNA2_/MRDRNA2_177630_c0_seq1.p1 gnl/MRDRNA2_/MRDRNA2_177630_c0~~gnl/MRDRNA2_/MRDRNA2_177630_c0_seq1.p1  ORF type:complete len:188 (-),score=47.31 gnl/MRDRNA2_/MRDRNA2_177630_c0_seq1:85-648(-)
MATPTAAEASQPHERSEASRALKASFRAWDVHGTGRIGQAELAHALVALDPGFPVKALPCLLSAAGASPRGSVAYDQFADWLLSGGSRTATPNCPPQTGKLSGPDGPLKGENLRAAVDELVEEYDSLKGKAEEVRSSIECLSKENDEMAATILQREKASLQKDIDVVTRENNELQVLLEAEKRALKA